MRDEKGAYGVGRKAYGEGSVDTGPSDKPEAAYAARRPPHASNARRTPHAFSSAFILLLILFLLTQTVALPAPYPLPSDEADQPVNLHPSLYIPLRGKLQQRAKERRDQSPQQLLEKRKQLLVQPNTALETTDLEEKDQQLKGRPVPSAPIQQRAPASKHQRQSREVLAAPQAPPPAGPPAEGVLAPGAAGKTEPALRRLMLQLPAPPTPAQLRILRERGLRIEFVRENYVQGLAGDDTLTALTELPFIRFIAPVVPAQAPAAPADRSPAPGKATAVKALLGLQELHRRGRQGGGVRMAVIDVGFDPEHPALRGRVAGWRSLRLDRDITGLGRWRHGTASAEVAAAVAPQARLYLLNFDPDSVFGYLQAIEEAVRDFHARIVVLAVNFPTPYDFYNGRGLLARALDGYTRRGVLFVTPAGNNALRHYTTRFSDPRGNGQHRFANRDALYFSLPAGRSAEIYLAWEDEWNDHLYRLGLYVFGEDRQVVAYSNARQGPPVQFCTVEAGNTDQTFAVVVSGRLTYRRDPRDRDSDRIAGRGPRFHLFVYGDSVTRVVPAVPESSLDPNFPTAESAITVGAVQAPVLARLEPFSSHGRTSDAREKPDLVAPSGVETQAMGFFRGTSAATPFVAGTAALLLAQHPSWKPERVKAHLRHTARDLGPAGWDIAFGAGLVDPAAALREGTP